MEDIIGMKDMEAIFSVTDALGIDREQVSVPLGKEDPGQVTCAPSGDVEIVVPPLHAHNRLAGDSQVGPHRLGIHRAGTATRTIGKLRPLDTAKTMIGGRAWPATR